MDQKQLYEQQVLRPDSFASPGTFGARESALFNWIVVQVKDALSGADAQLAELSVGDGQLSRALASAFLSLRIDCVDISPSRLEHARRMASENSSALIDRMRFLELNLDTQFSELPRDNYDVVVAIDVLEHVFDPFGFIRQCCEILKPNGGLFLRVPNIAYIKRRLSMMSGRLPITSSWFETPGSFESWRERHGWDGGHLHFFTLGALRWLLQHEGFEAISWSDVGSKAEPLRRLWPGMLFGNLAVFARKQKKT